MDARPLLAEVGRLREARLEAVLTGNAAAALHGAAVTTVDFDFFFRRTSRNLAKLKVVARSLGATILRPYYPASDLFRLVRDDDGLQVDFMATIHGVRSFEGVRDRATVMNIRGGTLLVASLDDIIRSTRVAAPARGHVVGKPRRRLVKTSPSRRRRLAAVRREADRALVELIRRRLALPPAARTNFLRKRVSPGRSVL